MKTTIRIIGLCLILIMINITVNAQKCKYSYEKTDPFTGENTKGTARIFIDPNTMVTMDRVGDRYLLNLETSFPQLKESYVEKGDSILLKLQNGNIVTFYTNNKYDPGYDYVRGTVYRPQYDMPVDKLKLLTESPISYIRANLGPIIYQKEVKDKKGQSLQHDANCILQ